MRPRGPPRQASQRRAVRLCRPRDPSHRSQGLRSSPTRDRGEVRLTAGPRADCGGLHRSGVCVGRSAARTTSRHAPKRQGRSLPSHPRAPAIPHPAPHGADLRDPCASPQGEPHEPTADPRPRHRRHQPGPPARAPAAVPAAHPHRHRAGPELRQRRLRPAARAGGADHRQRRHQQAPPHAGLSRRACQPGDGGHGQLHRAQQLQLRHGGDAGDRRQLRPDLAVRPHRRQRHAAEQRDPDDCQLHECGRRRLRHRRSRQHRQAALRQPAAHPPHARVEQHPDGRRDRHRCRRAAHRHRGRSRRQWPLRLQRPGRQHPAADLSALHRHPRCHHALAGPRASAADAAGRAGSARWQHRQPQLQPRHRRAAGSPARKRVLRGHQCRRARRQLHAGRPQLRRVSGAVGQPGSARRRRAGRLRCLGRSLGAERRVEAAGAAAHVRPDQRLGRPPRQRLCGTEPAPGPHRLRLDLASLRQRQLERHAPRRCARRQPAEDLRLLPQHPELAAACQPRLVPAVVGPHRGSSAPALPRRAQPAAGAEALAGAGRAGTRGPGPAARRGRRCRGTKRVPAFWICWRTSASARPASTQPPCAPVRSAPCWRAWPKPCRPISPKLC